MIQVNCSNCSKAYAIPDQFAGKKMRCKQCSTVIAIPAAAEPPPLEELAPPEPPPQAAPPALPAGPPVEKGPPAGEAPPPEEPAAEAPRKLGAKRFPSGKKFPSKKGAPGAKKGGPKGRGVGKGKFQGKKIGSKPRPGKKPGRRKKPRPEVAEGAVDAAAPESGSRKKLILVGGSVAAAALIAGAVYFIFFMDDSGTPTRPERGGSSELVTGKETPEEGETTPGVEAGESTEGEGTEVGVGTPPDEPEVLQQVDSLAVIPADSNLVVQVAFGQLANLPGLREQLETQVTSEEAAEFFTEAEFDPRVHLRTIWLATSLTGQESSPEEFDGIIIAEGVFNRPVFTEALKGRSLISTAPKKLGALEVYEAFDEDGEPAGFMTFIAEDKILFGSDAYFNKAVQLIGGGESVQSNEVLAGLSNNFTQDKIVRASFAFTQEIKDAIAAMTEGQEDTMPPIPDMNGASLALSRSADGTGVDLELAVHCASAEEVLKAQQWVNGLKMMAGMATPEDFKPLLASIQPAVEGSVLRVPVTLPEELLQSLENMPLPGMGPTPGEGMEGLEGLEGLEGIEGLESMEGVEIEGVEIEGAEVEEGTEALEADVDKALESLEGIEAELDKALEGLEGLEIEDEGSEDEL